MDIKSIKSKIDFSNPAVLGVTISIVLFIVIMGIYYYFIYSGLKTKAAQKETTFNQVKMKYDSYLSLVKSYPVLLKQDKKLDKEFAGLLLELPSKKNIPQLLMKISDYERLLNLNLKMFKPEKGVIKGFYETVPFSMNISGDFHNVYKFFYKLAVMKRIVNAHNISISRASKGNKVSVSFKGTTFSFIGTPPVKKAKANKIKPANIVQKNGGVIKK
ncbi:MAG: type IV pilus inner membrane component PilO [bacterium]